MSALSKEELAIYEIAYHLHMPVYIMLAEMPYDELVKWKQYFERRPIGWREDLRTYTLLKQQGLNAKPYEVFSSLKPVYQEEEDSRNTKGLQKSMLFQMMMKAKGGDQIKVE